MHFRLRPGPPHGQRRVGEEEPAQRLQVTLVDGGCVAAHQSGEQHFGVGGGRHQCAALIVPPSARCAAPVTTEARSEQRKVTTAATSAGSAKRPVRVSARKPPGSKNSALTSSTGLPSGFAWSRNP